MNTQANRSRYLSLLIVVIAVILSSTVGIAAVMGWLPVSTDGSDDILAVDNLPVASANPIAVTEQMASVQVEVEARTKGRCAECGVIVSMREIAARDGGTGPDASSGAVAGSQDGLRVTSARRYEITIRMADRSSRVINHESPASWRPGEHMILIGGANLSNR